MNTAQFFLSVALVLVLPPLIAWAGMSKRYAVALLASATWLVAGLVVLLASAVWPLSGRALLVVVMWVVCGMGVVALAAIEVRAHRRRLEWEARQA